PASPPQVLPALPPPLEGGHELSAHAHVPFASRRQIAPLRVDPSAHLIGAAFGAGLGQLEHSPPMPATPPPLPPAPALPPLPAHAPSVRAATPAAAASQSLLYVLPSQPHTGA